MSSLAPQPDTCSEGVRRESFQLREYIVRKSVSNFMTCDTFPILVGCNDMAENQRPSLNFSCPELASAEI